METLKRILAEHPAARILDVGTGVGNFLFPLKLAYDGFAEIVGIDQSENAVAAARTNFADDPRVRFERMDALAMTFPDASFDVVCLSNTLHHLADVRAVFAAMKRVLKADGILLVNEMVSDGLDAKQLSHREVHHFSAALDRAAGIVHRDTYTHDEIRRVLENESGLKIRHFWDATFPPQPDPTPEEIEGLATTVDRLLARIADAAIRDRFKAQGESVKAYVRAHGFAGATQFMLVL